MAPDSPDLDALEKSPPSEFELASEQRRQNRRLGLLVLGFLALLTAALGGLLFYDVPLPDDSRLLISDAELHPYARSSPPPRDPLGDFLRELESSRLKEVEDLAPQVWNLHPGREGDARAFLATQTQALAAYETLLSHASPQEWHFLENVTKPAVEWHMAATPLFNMTRVVKLRSRLELAQGQTAQALQTLTSLIQYGHALQRCSLVYHHYLAGSLAQRLGEAGLEEALTSQYSSADELASVQNMIANLEADRALYSRLLRTEYRCFKETLPHVAHSYSATKHRLLKPLTHCLLKPGMTTTARFQIDVELLNAVETSWQQGIRHQEFATREPIKPNHLHVLSPNPAGEWFNQLHIDSTSGILPRMVQFIALHRLVVLQLALRRYELAHGQLPRDLSLLVPRYLQAVPTDPYDDLRLRWDAGTQVLYAVGKNFTDDHGALTRVSHATSPDLGMYYWWSTAAAQAREDARQEELKRFYPRR